MALNEGRTGAAGRKMSSQLDTIRWKDGFAVGWKMISRLDGKMSGLKQIELVELGFFIYLGFLFVERGRNEYQRKGGKEK